MRKWNFKSIFTATQEFIFGRTRNPFNPEEFRHIALISFFAWIGLGADGLSSACYGPEESFLALGSYTHLAIFIAIATAVTVFIIAFAYNQVVELFPSGGGGYKVATQLLGSYAGLLSGAALIVDYVLTIAISTASGTDALYSLLPASAISSKLITESLFVGLLILLNLRGMKESIVILMPIFLSFVILHVGLIIYGIAMHHQGLPVLFQSSIHETKNLAQTLGWFTVLAFILHSYSLGSGTYTGIEAVSNNVNRLAEPRVRTGKITMFYMAVSLSITAAGMILLFLLWEAKPVTGETLNAVVFAKILSDSEIGQFILIITLLSEAGILLVAANTGFLAGPMVLANMSVDKWVPNRFRHLSHRLVVQNGIILFGIAALGILIWSKGRVTLLVVLYSINVFITFTMTLLGLCVFWIKHRRLTDNRWRMRFFFSLLGFIVAFSILILMVSVKFTEGGWFTVVITSIVIIICLCIKRHYNNIAKKLAAINLVPAEETKVVKNCQPSVLDPSKPTAVFFISENAGVGMHTLLWTLRLFPDHFKNFIFARVGVVDIQSFSGKQELNDMQITVDESLNFFVNYCQLHGLKAKSYADYGTDVIEHLMDLANKISNEFPGCIFFTSRLIFERENWLIRWLHNETPMMLQRRLHAEGKQLIILPMKI